MRVFPKNILPCSECEFAEDSKTSALRHRLYRNVVSFVLATVLAFGMPTAVFAQKRVVKEEEDFEAVNTTVTSEDKAALEKLPVEISAKAAVLMEVQTGTVLLEYNADKKLYPASVTKIMTMLLVAEAIDGKKISLSDKVVCSENAASKGGSQIWLEQGEEMTVDELLRATAIGSANDAATLLGEYVAGSESAFIDMMNSRAVELGMKNTHFENATGLDDTTDSHLTTAHDIALMSRELLKHTFITDYTTVWMDSLRNGETELVNTNKLVRFFDGTTGLKTGTTAKAGCCVSASAKRGELHLIAVVLGSASSKERFSSAKAMLNWGFSNYDCIKPTADEKISDELSIIGGESEFVALDIPDTESVVVKKGTGDSIKVTVNLPESVVAPVKNGQKIGFLTVTSAGKEIAKYNITAKGSVEKLGFWGYVKKVLGFMV